MLAHSQECGALGMVNGNLSVDRRRRIRELRVRLQGMAQKAIAEELGVSRESNDTLFDDFPA